MLGMAAAAADVLDGANEAALAPAGAAEGAVPAGAAAVAAGAPAGAGVFESSVTESGLLGRNRAAK